MQRRSFARSAKGPTPRVLEKEVKKLFSEMEAQSDTATHTPTKQSAPIKKQSLTPNKGKGIIVDKSMPIGEQIKAQANKKGKKFYFIDSEESVEWFLNTIYAPELSKKSYHKFRQEKDELIKAGEIPSDPEKQMEFISRHAKMSSAKVDEEISYNQA